MTNQPKLKHLAFSGLEMKQVVQEMWNNFMDTKWDGSVVSMPDHIKATIAAKRDPTHY